MRSRLICLSVSVAPRENFGQVLVGRKKNACQKNGYKMDFYCTLETGYLYAEILVFCLHVLLSFFVFMFSYLGLEVIVSIQTCLISYLLF